MTVSDGTYRIRNNKSKTYLDASLQHQGQVHGWGSRPDNKNQKWEVNAEGDDATIKNVGTGQYLFVPDHDKGTRAQTSGQTKTFTIAEHNGSYAIHPKNSSKVLDLDNGNPEDGASIALYTFNPSSSQQLWQFERVGGGGGGSAGGYGGGQRETPATSTHGYGGQSDQQQGGYGGQQQQQQGGYGGQQQQPQQQQQQQPQGNVAPPRPAGNYSGAVPAGNYRINNAKSGTRMDLAGGQSKEGATVCGWSGGEGLNQIWTFEAGQNGYRIRNRASGTYLTFQGNASEGTDLCGGGQAQEFSVELSPPDGYQLHLASNPNFVVDLAEGSSKDGAKILLWHNGKGTNQHWKLYPA